MAYVRGDSKNVIVGAAALFVNKNGPIPYLGKEEETARKGVTDPEYVTANKLPAPEEGKSYKETLSCPQLTEDNVYSEEGDCETDASDSSDASLPTISTLR